MQPDRLGTAQWADPEEFARQHTYAPGKFWLGRSPTGGEPLGFGDDRHVCLVSGSRSGKGATTIINNLCQWPGSVVVVDPKGENATVTAARRGDGSEYCEGMGQRVYVLDPFRAAKVDDRYRARLNPLDVLDPSRGDVISEAGRIADAIVVANPQSNDPSWDEGARSMIRALILHVLTFEPYEDRRHLGTIRELLLNGDVEAFEAIRDEAEQATPQMLLWAGLARNPALGGVIAGAGHRFGGMLERAPKQFEGMISNAINHTEFLDEPLMRECMSASDFAPSDLKTDPKGISVYLSLPQRFMGTHYRWLRMIVTLITTEMEVVSQQPACGHRVLICLDEFAGLRRMEVIENAVAQIAGYGVKLFFVLQSLEQLKGTYQDKWETFLSNSGLKLFFGIGDQFTREYVSKLVGETQLVLDTRTRSEGTNSSRSLTLGRNDSVAVNESLAIGESNSTGTSRSDQEGRSESDSFKRMPLFLRDTAGLVRHLAGSASASNSTSSSITTGTNETKGTSITATRGNTKTTGTSTSEAWTVGENATSGTNETIHKRPLINPDEVGTIFARIDDKNNPLWPGMCLVLAGDGRPAMVRRANYFADKLFRFQFDPHPDHPHTAPPRLMQEVILKSPFHNKDFNVFSVDVADAARHPVLASWFKQPGERVTKGDGLYTIDIPSRDQPRVFERVVVYAPGSGLLHECRKQAGSVFWPEYQADIGVFFQDIRWADRDNTISIADELQAYADRIHREALERREREAAAQREQQQRELASKTLVTAPTRPRRKIKAVHVFGLIVAALVVYAIRSATSRHSSVSATKVLERMSSARSAWRVTAQSDTEQTLRGSGITFVDRNQYTESIYLTIKPREFPENMSIDLYGVSRGYLVAQSDMIIMNSTQEKFADVSLVESGKAIDLNNWAGPSAALAELKDISLSGTKTDQTKLRLTSSSVNSIAMISVEEPTITTSWNRVNLKDLKDLGNINTDALKGTKWQTSILLFGDQGSVQVLSEFQFNNYDDYEATYSFNWFDKNNLCVVSTLHSIMGQWRIADSRKIIFENNRKLPCYASAGRSFFTSQPKAAANKAVALIQGLANSLSFPSPFTRTELAHADIITAISTAYDNLPEILRTDTAPDTNSEEYQEYMDGAAISAHVAVMLADQIRNYSPNEDLAPTISPDLPDYQWEISPVYIDGQTMTISISATDESRGKTWTVARKQP